MVQYQVMNALLVSLDRMLMSGEDARNEQTVPDFLDSVNDPLPLESVYLRSGGARYDLENVKLESVGGVRSVRLPAGAYDFTSGLEKSKKNLMTIAQNVFAPLDCAYTPAVDNQLAVLEVNDAFGAPVCVLTAGYFLQTGGVVYTSYMCSFRFLGRYEFEHNSAQVFGTVKCMVHSLCKELDYVCERRISYFSSRLGREPPIPSMILWRRGVDDRPPVLTDEQCRESLEKFERELKHVGVLKTHLMHVWGRGSCVFNLDKNDLLILDVLKTVSNVSLWMRDGGVDRDVVDRFTVSKRAQVREEMLKIQNALGRFFKVVVLASQMTITLSESNVCVLKWKVVQSESRKFIYSLTLGSEPTFENSDISLVIVRLLKNMKRDELASFMEQDAGIFYPTMLHPFRQGAFEHPEQSGPSPPGELESPGAGPSREGTRQTSRGP